MVSYFGGKTLGISPTTIICALSFTTISFVPVVALADVQCPDHSHWQEGYGCKCDSGYTAGPNGCVPQPAPDPGNPCNPMCDNVLAVVDDVHAQIGAGPLPTDAGTPSFPSLP